MFPGLEQTMKKFVRRSLITLGAVAGLLVVFRLEEDVRGHWLWTSWQRTQLAKGRVLDPKAYVPGSVPDPENFGAAPIVNDAVQGRPGQVPWALPGPFLNPPQAGQFGAGLTADYQAWEDALKGENLEAALRPMDAALDAWVEASRRPHSRWLVDYANQESIPTLLGMRGMSRILRVRALAQLRAHHPERAIADVEAGCRMIGHLQKEPQLLSQLLRMAWTGIFLQPVWEGTASHAWNDEQLARIEADLAPVDLLASVKLAWGFERAGFKELGNTGSARVWEDLLLDGDPPGQPKGTLRRAAFRYLFPKGWFYLNLRAVDQGFEALVEPVLDPASHRVHVEVQERFLDQLKRQPRVPFNLLAAKILPSIGQQNVRVARAQASVDMARIACALERYRLAHATYPGDLGTLAPAFLPAIPKDVVTGKDLHYQRKGASYVLYSVGWNLKDDGGAVGALAENGGMDFTVGDWVWFAEATARR